MRKITQQAINAFLACNSFALGNTSVRTHIGANGLVVDLYLHGNLIATRVGFGPDYDVTIRDAGYRTRTTKERLNGLLDSIGVSRIYQHDFNWFIGKSDWNGSALITIRDGITELQSGKA